MRELSMLLVGWTDTLGWGVEFVEVMASIYVGFAPTIGGEIGGIWGFVDGMIAGAIVAFTYNLVAEDGAP